MFNRVQEVRFKNADLLLTILHKIAVSFTDPFFQWSRLGCPSTEPRHQRSFARVRRSFEFANGRHGTENQKVSKPEKESSLFVLWQSVCLELGSGGPHSSAYARAAVSLQLLPETVPDGWSAGTARAASQRSETVQVRLLRQGIRREQ